MLSAFAESRWPVFPTPIDTQGSTDREGGGVAGESGLEIDATGTDSCAYTIACWPGVTTSAGAASTR
jgi:hypothetical protein